MDKQDYIARLQTTIQHLHNCGAVHMGSAPVHEIFRGETVWQGIVEVFDLHNHTKAKRAYAWSHPEGPQDTGERIVTVLEIPPVKDARTAVQASIMSDLKKSQK